MNKFTIFTVILAISVITVTADLALRDYFLKEGEANVLNEEISPVIAVPQPEAVEPSKTVGPQPSAEPQPEVQPEPELEAREKVVPQPSSTINDKVIRETGLEGSLTEAQFDGKVFQLLDITKIPIEAVYFYDLLDNQSGKIASVTEISLPDEIRALQLYSLLQNKTKTYIDLSLNETNAYGDRSFYINHAKKPDEAFLTVKIRKKIYAFAYVKLYHPQIKKLIELLYG